MSLLKRIEGAGTPPAAAGGAVTPAAPATGTIPQRTTGGLNTALANAGNAPPTTPLMPAGAAPARQRQGLDTIAALRRPGTSNVDNFSELRSRVQQKLIQDIGPNADFSQAH